jgi:uncharacterized protein
MQLAVNYTPQAAALLDAGQIDFDLYKCPDWPHVIEQARRQRPAYVHFPLHAGRGRLDQVDWSTIEALLQHTDTHFVNVHLAPHSADFPGMSPDTTDPAWTERLVERVLADVLLVRQRFGPERVILENVPWDPDPDYSIPRPVTLPETIAQIVRETGCGFLLDIAHARIAALHLEMDEFAYLDMLPVENLREVHVTGTLYDADAGYWRDHFEMTPDDWALVDYTLDRIGHGLWPQPQIVALEYGGVGPMFDWRSEPEVIAREVPRLAQMLHTAQLNATGA